MSIELKDFSLDPMDYESIVTTSGIIVSKKDDRFTIHTDDNVELDFIVHPKIVEAYQKKEKELDIDDDIDLLGAYIYHDKQTSILALRCIIYEKPPTLVS